MQGRIITARFLEQGRVVLQLLCLMSHRNCPPTATVHLWRRRRHIGLLLHFWTQQCNDRARPLPPNNCYLNLRTTTTTTTRPISHLLLPFLERIRFQKKLRQCPRFKSIPCCRQRWNRPTEFSKLTRALHFTIRNKRILPHRSRI